MPLTLTLGAIPPGLIVLLVVVFLIGRWVFRMIQESKAHARKRDGLENPNQNVNSPTSDEGRATRGEGGGQGGHASGVPTNLSVSEHAEREKARQQYAERAERLRAQRLGKAMPGGAGGASGAASTTASTPTSTPTRTSTPTSTSMPTSQAERADEGWTTTPSPASHPAPMEQSRPLPTQEAKALPSNRPAQQTPPPARSNSQQMRPAQVAKKPAARPATHASGAEAIIPGAPAGVGISDVSPQQARASGGQMKATPQSQQAARVTSQAPVQHALGRIGTIEDLRRAVVLRELLDPPVSLRE